MGVPGRANTTATAYGKGWRWHAVARIQHFSGERFNGRTARFWYWPIRCPTRGLFLALLAHFGALLGLCGGRAMLGRARPGLQCLFSLDKCTVLGARTVCLAYGLAYVLAYGIARAWLALSVRPSVPGFACCQYIE